MTAPVVVARGLRKSYGDLTVLDGVDLDVARGRGARPARSQRRRQDHDRPHPVHAAAARRRHRARRRQGRRPAGRPRCAPRSASPGSSRRSTSCSPASRTCTSWPGWRTWAAREVRTRSAELLELFDLTDAGRRVVKTYSGGMRRRLDLAVGLLARPQVVFLDEPTTGPRPAQPQRPLGRHPGRRRRRAPPCCSPRSTSRRPTSWPTGSRSSTTGG